MNKSLSKLLGNDRWLFGNFSHTDEQMRRQFRAKHSVEPKRVFRWGCWVYAGPEPEEA